MSLAVFDVDGVVADVRHRLHFIDTRPKNWRGFFGTAGDDPALSLGVELVRIMQESHEIVWLTGRPSYIRDVTVGWLSDLGLPTDQLIMRRGGDYRPAHVYKLEALRRLNGRGVQAFIDDDPEVIEAALKAGFPAQLADWVPRSQALVHAQERSGRT